MARARNIKPSFFINEELVECRFETRLLFIGLWTLADREGRLEDKPKKIKMALFPADNIDIELSLNELSEHGFIQRYEIDGEKYIQVIAFKKHQNPHRDEKASTIPEFIIEKHSASTVQAQCKDDANTVAIGLIPDSLNTDTSIKPLSGKPDVKADAIEILEHLNLKAGRKYKAVKANISMIEARLKDFTKDELMAVVDDRCIAWAKDEKMSSYLRPETLFNATKCAGYVGSLGAITSSQGGRPWYLSSSGIETKAKELGIIQNKDEHFQTFKLRVYESAGVTPEMLRKASIDYPLKVAL